MVDDQDKPICKYGIKCYQRNEAHKNRFSHPSDNSDENKLGASTSPNPRQPEKKLKLSSPTQSNDGGIEDQESSGNEEDICVLNESNDVNGELNDTNRPSSSNQQNILTNKIIEEVKEKGNENTTVATKPTAVKFETIDNKFIELNFLVSMPDDFYKFWEFCCIESKSKSPELLFSKFGLRLVGPFDVLANKFNKPFEKNEYLRHWRFYYDPPEFQTVMVKEKTGIHYGYWRDDPNGECLIARNNADDGCEFTFVADNLFGAVLHYLDKDIQLSLFNRSNALTLKKSLDRYANKENISLASFSAKLKVRNSKVVSKTFHRAGLVVPFNRKTDVGYRPLGESDVKLKKLLKKFDDANSDKGKIMTAMDELQPLITAANIACDECDFGNTIELGIDLFCFGSPELHPVALQLLSTGYSMVKRSEYIEIIKSHLEDRKKGCMGLSILGT